MKVNTLFLHNSKDRKKGCKKEYGTSSPSFRFLPSKCFPAADRNESQAWMSPVEIPRGTRAVLSPSQYHTAVQSLKRLQNSHHGADQLPTQRDTYLAVYSLLSMSLLWQVHNFSAFYHILLSQCTNNEHLCSSCPLYLQPQVSASQSSLFSELY